MIVGGLAPVHLVQQDVQAVAGMKEEERVACSLEYEARALVVEIVIAQPEVQNDVGDPGRGVSCAKFRP